MISISHDRFATSRIELSESALRKNIRFLQKQIGTEPLFSSVIKGNAYGHGISEFLPLAEKCGLRHFSVFSAAEAYKALSSRTQDSHIMIMGAIEDEELAWAVEHGISFYIFDPGRLHAAVQAARKMDSHAQIHLELETGLNRTGLAGAELESALKYIVDNRSHVRVKGVCTHFAGAESVANYLRIQNQIERFNAAVSYINAKGIYPELRHTACSAASLIYPASVMDMVRIGIAHYGFWPTEETRIHHFLRYQNNPPRRFRNPLHRVMSWKSRIMSVKHVPAGEFISYGNSYMSTRDMCIASVPVGYYHGFSRSLSNLGRVLVRGRRARVVGVVNMNMFIIDVSHIPGVERGDEVVIIGRQKSLHVSVGSFADMTNNLNYEVLTRIPPDIPRVVVP